MANGLLERPRPRFKSQINASYAGQKLHPQSNLGRLHSLIDEKVYSKA